MQTATFNPNGGPLVADIRCGFAQPGAYTLLVWESNANVVVMEKRGNFINADDDAYELPTPVAQNDGRLAECIATVVITPPIKDYTVSLVISQDGREIAADTATGQASGGAVPVDLFVNLRAG
jgi:hypothetical protein